MGINSYKYLAHTFLNTDMVNTKKLNIKVYFYPRVITSNTYI
jgi:hypothetical protein